MSVCVCVRACVRVCVRACVCVCVCVCPVVAVSPYSDCALDKLSITTPLNYSHLFLHCV